jgi:3-keto-5-aminohexanoate cleavage enzyme
MEKLIIEAALNELFDKADNPNIPYGPDECVRDALACVAAGASIVHFHSRDPRTGAQRWTDAALYAEAYRRIQAESDVIFYPTYPARGHADRFRHVHALAEDPSVRLRVITIDPGGAATSPYDASAKRFTRPDHQMQNTHAEVVPLLEMARERGLRVIFGAREIGHVRHVLAYHDMGLAPEPIFLKLYFDAAAGFGLPPNFAGLNAYLTTLPHDVRVEWAMWAYGASHMRLNALAVAAGGHVRTGLGDNPRLGDGRMTSADQVRQVAELARLTGREVASPAEARALLGIP